MERGNELCRLFCCYKQGNGKSAVMAPVQYLRMYAEMEMEAQIHHLEQEAYSSVIPSFKAQADAITWEKEGIIIELRKQLRLSNEEHRELLGKVNADVGRLNLSAH